MTVMGVKVITSDDASRFSKEVNEFLSECENLLLHDKTIFSVNVEEYHDDPYHGSTIIFSAIFYGEIGNKI